MNGVERKQIDFHQGFILDALDDFIINTRPDDGKYLEALLKGVDFYKNEQFLPDGRCKWRYPRRWPIDIHNQAQGIITFSRLRDRKPEYLDFARTIADWTITHMQDKSGYFYYQKWPIVTNKISYIRWGQAWMLFALSTLLEWVSPELKKSGFN
jgi:rhamnogalacturonyl hydrolase YesR